ncbi:MAG: hypothetical protein ACI9TZ_003162 [Yoonia sp.]|jgi:hypothetical protein
MKLLPEPAMRSPSQWPGTARSSTSAGLSRIDTASLNLPIPVRFRVAWRDRRMARVALRCTSSSFLSTPRVWINRLRYIVPLSGHCYAIPCRSVHARRVYLYPWDVHASASLRFVAGITCVSAWPKSRGRDSHYLPTCRAWGVLSDPKQQRLTALLDSFWHLHCDRLRDLLSMLSGATIVQSPSEIF